MMNKKISVLNIYIVLKPFYKLRITMHKVGQKSCRKFQLQVRRLIVRGNLVRKKN